MSQGTPLLCSRTSQPGRAIASGGRSDVRCLSVQLHMSQLGSWTIGCGPVVTVRGCVDQAGMRTPSNIQWQSPGWCAGSGDGVFVHLALKLYSVLSSAYAQGLHLQAEIRVWFKQQEKKWGKTEGLCSWHTQVGALDLGDGVLVHLALEAVQRVQPEALAGRGSAGPTRPLLSRSLADGGHHQALHPCSGAVGVLLAEAGIHHVLHTHSMWEQERRQARCSEHSSMEARMHGLSRSQQQLLRPFYLSQAVL